MRAAVVKQYGPPENVRILDVPTPEVGEHDVLVRITAAAVTAADSRIRAARFPRGFAPFARLAFGITQPRQGILGGSLAGVVEAVGPAVTRVAVGDRVSAMTGAKMRAHAEFIALGEDRLSRTPDAVTDEDAAGLLFGGTTALHFLRDKTSIGPGTTVLVNGASGAVGSNGVQLARHFGGVVTGVTSTANVDTVRGLGAATVIDYTRTPVETIAERFDVVFDTIGTISPALGRTLAGPQGTVLLAAADLPQMLRARGAKTGTAPERTADVDFLLGLAASGDLRSLTDTVMSFDDIVEAHRRVDSGRKVGNVIVRPHVP